MSDALREVRLQGGLALRRVVTAPGGEDLVLRLARHQDIARTSDSTAVVDGWLQVRSYAAPLLLVTDGDQKELRLALRPPTDGAPAHQIDYSRVEGK